MLALSPPPFFIILKESGTCATKRVDRITDCAKISDIPYDVKVQGTASHGVRKCRWLGTPSRFAS